MSRDPSPPRVEVAWSRRISLVLRAAPFAILPRRFRGPFAQRFLHRIGVENRDRRLTELAGRGALEIDRRAAARALHLLHLGADARKLGPIEGTHELLLAQELEERREAAVLVRTTVVREASGLTEVLRERQRGLASRTIETALERAPLSIAMTMQKLEKLENSARRELRALGPVEPKGMARKA